MIAAPELVVGELVVGGLLAGALLDENHRGEGSHSQKDQDGE
jgi:hypothetical protein